MRIRSTIELLVFGESFNFAPLIMKDSMLFGIFHISVESLVLFEKRLNLVMCFNYKSLCCGYISLDIASFTIGSIGIFVSLTALVVIILEFLHAEISASMIVFSVISGILLLINALLLYGISRKKKAILKLWLSLTMAVILVSTL